ncbi:MAG: DUF11 domain-containing protein [Acidobacteria bacterium]|nr:DUF11 domain-containing protein [Acidobacteriota bacterium]
MRRTKVVSAAKRVFRLLLLGALVLCGAASASAFTITRTSSPIFYFDTGVNPQLRGMYVSYQITNTGAAQPDVWVRLDTSGGNVTLAANEDGLFQFGPMATGETRTAFFYIQATTQTATPQSQTVRVFPTRPPATELASASFTMTVAETIQANANKVVTTVAGPDPPGLGGIVTMTVTGATGSIGAAKILSFTPASFAAWRADVFELTSSSFVLSGGNNGTFVNQLLIPASAITSTSNTNYTLTYTFRATGSASAPIAVDPFGFLSSGTQVKHTTVDTVYIQPPVNSLTMSKSASAAQVYVGGIVTYTLRLTNSGAYDSTIAEFTDTLPSSPATPTYVTGSSAYNGVAIANPAVSGAVLTWVGSFIIPAGQSRDLTFRVTIPATEGTYTNSAVARIGSTQIDGTLNTSDNSPASVNVQAVRPPTITLVKSAAASGAFVPGTDIVYTITFSNTGGVAAQSLTIVDIIPVSDSGTGVVRTTLEPFDELHPAGRRRHLRPERDLRRMAADG